MSLRLGVDPKHADQMVRGAIVLPARHRQGGARGRVRQGREGARGARGRRRRGRRRGSRRADPGRLDGLRLDDRHARPHGAGRAARQGAGAARPHAQSQAGHGDLRRRAGGARRQGGQGGVPRGQGRQRARAGREEVVHAWSSWRRTRWPCSRPSCGRSRRPPRGSTCARSRCRRRWGRASTSTSSASPTSSRNETRSQER